MVIDLKKRLGIPQPDDTRMSFGEHLEELRRRIIKAIIGVVVGMAICLLGMKPLFSALMRPALVLMQAYDQEPTLLSLSPPDTFMVYIKIAVLCGLIISSPYWLWQAWAFVAVGLYEKERRFVRRFGFISPFLFLAGVGFMFWIVLPVSLNFFVRFNRSFPLPALEPNWIEKRLIGSKELPENQTEVTKDLQIPVLADDPEDPAPGSMWFDQRGHKLKIVGPDQHIYGVQMRSNRSAGVFRVQYSIDFYVSFLLRLAIAFGVAFQLPIVVLFLAATGLVSVVQMAQARRYVILGITILAAVLTPPDVFSQVLLVLPMIGLFEGALLFARTLSKK